MDETGIVRQPGHLDPRAQEFRPRNIPSPQNQVALLHPQIYYPSPSSYPSTGVQAMPFYDGGIGYHSAPLVAYPRPSSVNPPQPPPSLLPPPSATVTRALLLSSVPTDVNETTLRREVEVFGVVRAVQMERLQEGIVTVHFYDSRHAQAAMMEIREQHMQQQSRLRQYYNSLLNQNLWIDVENSAAPMPPPARGLIAGRAVWAQFTVPTPTIGPDGQNQGTLVVFNLDSGVSASNLKEIFEAFGPVKELRETPSKRHQRFVEFFDVRDAARALSEMNGREIGGKNIVIEFSRPGGHGRRLLNAAATSATSNINKTTTASDVNRSSYQTMSTGNYSQASAPPSLPPRFLGQSTSDSSLTQPSQTQHPNKKPGFTRKNIANWNSNSRSNYGAPEAVAGLMGSLSLSVVGNESEGDEDRSGSSRRRTRKSSGSGSNSNTSNKGNNSISSAATKLPKSRSWKGRQKNSDVHFLINEDAMIDSDCRDTRTTVMIKNIPNKYSQKLLLNMLDNHCINCNEQIGDGDDQPLSSYDFVYLPIDFSNKCNVGYGFVNLTSPQATWRLYKAFHLQPWEVFNSKKICEVTYARLQGLETLKEHFKNSKFACETDDYLPVVFSPPRDGKNLTEPIPIGAHSSATTNKRLGHASGDDTREEEDDINIDGDGDNRVDVYEEEGGTNSNRIADNNDSYDIDDDVCGNSGVEPEVCFNSTDGSTVTCTSAMGTTTTTTSPNGCLSTEPQLQQPKALSMSRAQVS
ncbi:PREDICTED: protein terminal ear1 [Nelumbo nucifera]|uniref:Protein terminal ear1 n=1 Tax=Nelumbo nucifera TaxID=4432 RepID=A0A1U7ZDR7_NELNU|nr:PREDICTED: protein terminal ear1 [Nelumbo nucifera]